MTYTPLVPRFFPPTLTTDLVATGSSSRTGVTCTASAVAHAAGLWQEVEAALAEECCGLSVCLSTGIGSNTVNTSTLLEIGIGGAGAETVWATIPVGYKSATNIQEFVPGLLAAGERVSVRARSAVALQSVQIRMMFFASRGLKNYGPPVTYGVDTSASKGMALTAPGSVNTKSAWTELSSGVSKNLTALYLGIQGNAGTAMSGTGILVDIGKGPAGGGSEQVIVEDVYFLGGSSENYLLLSPTTYRVDVLAGERLYARYARMNAANAVDAILVAA